MSGGVDPALRSYRPGEWLGILGEHASVLLPPGERARVGALWSLVDDGAGFDEVLDALIAGGLRGLPGFVLVGQVDGETRVLLRGAVRATLSTEEESVAVEGTAAATWVERALRGVTGLVVEVPKEPEDSHDLADADQAGADLVTRGGVVRLSRLDHPPYAGRPDGRYDGGGVRPADDGAGGDDAPSDRVSSRVEPTWAEEPAAEEPAAQEPGMEDLDTELLAVESRPVAAGGPVARLRLSSGDAVDVDRVLLVGRAPEARRFGAEPPRLVTVPSPHLEVSATHLEVRPGSGRDHGAALATDLGSTNGTVLVQPGESPQDLHPDVAVRLRPGAVLDLGDGVTIRVDPA